MNLPRPISERHTDQREELRAVLSDRANVRALRRAVDPDHHPEPAGRMSNVWRPAGRGARDVLIWIPFVVGPPLVFGRLEPAELSLPFIGFLVVIAVATTVRSDARLRQAGQGWRHRLVEAVTTIVVSVAALVVTYLVWTTIGPDREAAPATAAYRALEGVIGTLNAQLLLVGILLVLVLLGYRQVKAADRQDRASP